MSKTLADIARLAGVSTATVSRVLNHQGQVSPETRETILRAVKKQSFVPRTYKRTPPSIQAGTPLPQHASTQQGLIEIIWHAQSPMERVHAGQAGLEIEPLEAIAPQELLAADNRLSTSFYLRIIEGVIEESMRHGLRAVVTPCPDLHAPQFLTALARPDKTGVILLGAYDERIPEWAARCAHPLVCADLVFENGPFALSFDNASGMAQLVAHLVELGHRQIGCVAGPQHMTGFRERLSALRGELFAHGLPALADWIYTGSNHMEHVAAWALEFLKRPDRPTALVCGNDFIALGVQRAARQLGLKLPQQLSLAGFDDNEPAMLNDPPLTTVRVPTLDLGRAAVQQLLLQQHVGRAERSCLLTGACLRLPVRLIARASTARPG